MYQQEMISELIDFIEERSGQCDKKTLSAQVQQKFGLSKERSVFYGEYFAVRFCSAASRGFSNTVLALSKLQKYDARPFIVCLVTPEKNYLMLANTTFLKKISHSSQQLRCDNIKGSFNGHDIMHDFEGIANEPENFEFLFASHEGYTFAENLQRLVEATNQIAATGRRFEPDVKQLDCIRQAVARTEQFFESEERRILEEDLRSRVKEAQEEIALASYIDNVNVRGRVIECLITENGGLKETLGKCLRAGKPLPEIFTADGLGDYERTVGRYVTATDIKTKVLFLSGNPKGYNIDKLLSFLAKENSVYLVCIVAIDRESSIRLRLCSPYHRQLLAGTRIIKHWAGRNSRGVTQYDGRSLEEIVFRFDGVIDRAEAEKFLEMCIAGV